MKRLIQAPSAGSTTRTRTTGAFGRFTLALLGAILAAMLLAGPAAAAPEELEHFGCTGGVACQRLSVDEASGDVYVVDPTNNSVDRYSKTGTLLGQLKVPAAEGGSFGFGGAPDVAVDNSGTATQGRVYVSQGEASTKVFAFDPSNEAEPFLWAAGGFGEACGIAVDPSGMPWEGDWGEGVQQLNPADGSKTGVKITTIEGPCHIAFDSAGNALINQWNLGIFKTTQTGALVEPPVGGAYSSASGIGDVAVDTVDDGVYGVDYSQGAIHSWSADGSSSESFASAGIGVTVDAFRGRLYFAHGSEVSVYAVPGVTFPLTVSVEGEGVGQVDADTGAIEGCTKSGGTCTGEYGYEAEVTLTATEGEHSTFAGWSGGGCSGTGPTCTVTTTEATEVTATFDSTMRTLTVNKTGSGTVECKLGAGSFGPCAAAYDAGSEIEVKATPGAHFAQGAIGGTGSAAGCAASPCSFTLEAASTLNVAFTQITHTLTIATAGTGSGSVTCDGGACAASYPEGATVTLAVSAASGSTFAGWSGGGCSGTGGCAVTIVSDTAVTATFNALPKEEEEKPDLYGQCVAKAAKAYVKALKKASHKHGKARATAKKAAKKAKKKAIARCRTQFK